MCRLGAADSDCRAGESELEMSRHRDSDFGLWPGSVQRRFGFQVTGAVTRVVPRTEFVTMLVRGSGMCMNSSR